MPVVRHGHLAENIVIVDGQPGCGKTMLSPIIASLDRVELLTYAYELEYICAMHYVGAMTADAAQVMAGMLTDLQLYNSMMGREINVRPTDLSSIWRDANPWRYVKRMFQDGDEKIPARIKEEKPILHLTTHNLLPFSNPLWENLGNRLKFIEVVRHPLYMIKQQALNMTNILGDPRDFTIYVDYKGQQLPYYAFEWPEIFINSNPVEKSIWHMQHLSNKVKAVRSAHQDSIISIPFETFVLNPWGYMQQIEQALETRVVAKTRQMMKKQRVPRARIEDGLALKIYKRCGWTPPQANSEEEEFNIRRNEVAKQVSKNALAVLDAICIEYEEQFLGGKKNIPSRNV